MRGWVIALIAAASVDAAAKPATVEHARMRWQAAELASLLDDGGYVVVLLKAKVDPADPIQAVVTLPAPGPWHVYVLYDDDPVDSGDRIMPGASLPVIGFFARGELIAARSSSSDLGDAERWMTRNADRVRAHLFSPLDCARRFVDIWLTSGRLGADDLWRYAALIAARKDPRSRDPLVHAWGVLASFPPITDDARDVELGDLVLEQGRDRVLLVDQPTAGGAARVDGTAIERDGTTSAGAVGLIDAARTPRRDVVVLRPSDGLFCRE